MARQQKLIKEIPTLWRPEFIPYYPVERDMYRLSYREALLYGFIRHFLKNCSGRFFFTNEQLRYVLGGKRNTTASETVSKLVEKCPEVSVSYIIKKDGGKIRYIGYVNANPDLRKSGSPTYGKAEVIESTIKNTIRIRENFDKNIEIKRENQNYTLLAGERAKFIDYWTEKSPNGKKERWEFEKVFDIKRRWGTWLRNVERRMQPTPFVKETDRGSRGGGMQKIAIIHPISKG